MYSNWFFTVVFVLEMCLKVFALGMAGYLSDKWNQLDMIIVVLSVVGIILEILNEGTKLGVVEIPINISIIRVMRVLRIARVLKLLKTAKGVRRLLETVAHALPQVGNLGLLFLLLFFIFAALGVELFGTIGLIKLIYFPFDLKNTFYEYGRLAACKCLEVFYTNRNIQFAMRTTLVKV